MKEDFRTLYKNARQKHQELLSLPDEVFELIASRDREESRGRQERTYLILMSFLPFLYGLVALSAAALWRQTSHVAQRLASLHYRAIFQALPASQLALSLVIVTLLTYFVFMPILNRWGGLMMPKSLQMVDCTSRSYIVVQVIAVWVGLGLAIVFMSSFLAEGSSHSGLALKIGSQSNLRWFFTIWTVPFVVVLSSAPLLLLVVALAMLFAWRDTKRATSSISILRSLLEVLSSWDLTGAPAAGPMESQRSMAQRLSRVAEKLRRLNFGLKPDGKDEKWAARQYALAADNLLVCGSWLYVPQAQSIETVRLRVLVFCNAFLTGQLSDLPRSEISESEGLVSNRPKQAVIRTVLFAGMVLVYCVVPFVLFPSLQHRLAAFGIPTNLWLLLYSLWLAIGVFAYLEHTSQNTGETFINLVKIILGK
jgi:hypothetical protein